MIISYHALGCLRLSHKANVEQSLVIDPYDTKVAGLKPQRLKADVVIATAPDSNLANNFALIKAASGEFHTITSPGEYDYHEMFIQAQGVAGQGPAGNIFYLEIDNFSIGLLGLAAPTNLNGAQTDLLEDVDILIVPVGGTGQSKFPILSAAQAKQVVNQVEPRLVIPTYYRVPGLKVKLAAVNDFIKELDVKQVHQAAGKLKLAKKDLPTDDIGLAVISPTL